MNWRAALDFFAFILRLDVALEIKHLSLYKLPLASASGLQIEKIKGLAKLIINNFSFWL
jgi:hypothetical protein